MARFERRANRAVVIGVADGIARPRLRLFNAVGAVVLENAGWANNSDVAATAARANPGTATTSTPTPTTSLRCSMRST